MSLTGMKVYEVPQDSTAAEFHYTVEDDDGFPDDGIAGGHTVLFHAKTEPPSSTSVTRDAVGDYLTDGSDAILKFELTANEVSTPRDLWCEFEVQGLVSGTFITDTFILRIKPRARV